MNIQRLSVHPRYSQCVVSGEQIETSGIVAHDLSQGIGAQTRDVLQQLDALLALANVDKTRLTRVQVWLADMSDFAAMNEVYDAWVDTAHPPARACVGAALADSRYRLEIQANAVL
ncbi:Enamine deaminase RidA, house cleaning of reactive enamine intermediates, YjgF/YER057c/UK114 family [Pseudomonas sp. ok272]|uniref:RidA family protein n=1 Tax=unclassified Pseudomonas TaxID=196821 RepID=UPI0008AB2097|nr:MULTISPECIES: RidA family protein [unclassified Pseudomonas]SEN52451.1 Enamine deaminase RidA, house cleaning of reactive enamine intermediates, YjgF/YER057c/UK114 family [Pseudomonas sp. ok272]SFN33152.1 Enamine deaminase RidA, house cleaning of reactive enamine intermediates, YjgF/YER057c/UK114 family [Pseudomonas sp. ok602]